MIESFTEKLSNRLILGILLGGLLLFTYAVLQPFIIPSAWAIIIAYATWPVFRRLRTLLRNRASLAAFLMSSLLALAFLVPAVWVALTLHHEMDRLTATLDKVIAYLSSQRAVILPTFIADIPMLGSWLQETISNLTSDPKALHAQILVWFDYGSSSVLKIIGGAGRNLVKLGIALVTVFFIYRDGERLLDQVKRILHRFLGARVDSYLSAVGKMTMAVVWGILATAVAQGCVAGIGYWIFGVPAPLFFGAVTILFSMIPFCTPFTWGALAIWLLINGDTFNGVGLLLWGALLVSWIDNLIRPYVISSATRISFLLIMFGVLGGLAAFGLIGLFIGPVILAVVMAVWQEWLGTAIAPTPPSSTSTSQS